MGTPDDDLDHNYKRMKREALWYMKSSPTRNQCDNLRPRLTTDAHSTPLGYDRLRADLGRERGGLNLKKEEPEG